MALKKIKLPDETVVEIQDSRIPGVDTTPTSGSVNLITSGGVSAAIPTKTSDLTNDSGFMTGMTILSYGHSTWQDFMDAYTDNKVVYCRASSNANPATGAQSRMAFMAYVGGTNQASPTNVEFQYYRSVSSHTITQQGDQVFVYTLKSNGTWSVITREATAKVVAGTGLTSTYANDTLTLNATAVAATATPLMDGTAAVGTATKYAREDHVHPSDSSKANDSAVVHNTGNETIAGNKTFSGYSSFAGSEFGGDVDFIDATIYNESATDFDWIQDGNGYSVQDALDAILPSVTASDNGKGLVVNNGAWAAGELNYLPTSGGTVYGVLGVGNTNACKIHFQRDAANYITAVTGGYFCFGPNGANTTVASSSLVIEDGCTYSGKTSNLGKNDHFWNNAYISNLYLNSNAYLSYDSTNGLTYNGNSVYHAGNIPNLDVIPDGTTRRLSDCLTGTLQDHKVTGRASDNSNTWGALGFESGDEEVHGFKILRFGATPGTSFGGTNMSYGSGLYFGGGDTRAFMGVGYLQGYIEFAGGSVNNPTKTPDWHFAINGANATIYDLGTISSNAANGNTAYTALGTAALGSQTKPIYYTGSALAECTYSLNATVNSGTSGKLSYYSTANEISSYTSTAGGSATPIYLNAGVPTSCDLSTTYAPYYSAGYVKRDGDTLTGKFTIAQPTSATSAVDITGTDVILKYATAPTLNILTVGSANIDNGSIFFGNTGNRNGFKITSKFTASAARQSLVFYRSNVTTSPYAFNPTELMRLTHDGNVNVTGNITATGTITPGSDSRIKDNQKEISQEDAFSVIENLKPKTWTWNEKSNENLDGKIAAGLVAQEVKEILPEAVTITKTEDFEDFHSLNYNTIQGYEIAAIKGLLEEVKALKAEIVELKNKLNNK